MSSIIWLDGRRRPIDIWKGKIVTKFGQQSGKRNKDAERWESENGFSIDDWGSGEINQKDMDYNESKPAKG